MIRDAETDFGSEQISPHDLEDGQGINFSTEWNHMSFLRQFVTGAVSIHVQTEDEAVEIRHPETCEFFSQVIRSPEPHDFKNPAP